MLLHTSCRDLVLLSHCSVAKTLLFRSGDLFFWVTRSPLDLDALQSRASHTIALIHLFCRPETSLSPFIAEQPVLHPRPCSLPRLDSLSIPSLLILNEKEEHRRNLIGYFFRLEIIATGRRPPPIRVWEVAYWLSSLR